MKPVRQTIFGHEEGNCAQACVASLLELPLGAVPNFRKERDQQQAMTDFFRYHKRHSLYLQFAECYWDPKKLAEMQNPLEHLFVYPSANPYRS